MSDQSESSVKRVTRVLLLLVILALIGGGVAGFVALQFFEKPASESEVVVIFEVRPGESFKTIARRLEQEGLVSSAAKLEFYARFSGAGKRVKVGEYAVRRNMKPKELVDVITSGRSVEYVVTVSEGMNMFEIGDVLEKQGIVAKSEFIAHVRDKAFIKELLGEELPSLEGYLFPETYHITKFTGGKGLVKVMVERFKENFKKVQAASGVHLSRHQLITLASIIEKETGAPEERPVISSVFHNRLRLNMKLQTDPTVVYGLWERTGQWNRNISRGDLMRPNRYNTYSFAGLPYGPIANPGFEALKAAAAPATTEFLFFVSRNDGTHVFSKEYAQHQKAVMRFQLDKKAREGKSWRDLKNRQSAPTKVVEAAAAEPPKPAPATKPSSVKPH